MKNVFELRKLTKAFYDDYPESTFPEIERKQNRPYAVLLIKISDRTFAIPFRSNIRHRYCYKFKTSDRSTDSSTGLDYSKAVVITKAKYLGNRININNKEYIELQKKCFFIRSKFEKYVKGYLKILSGKTNPFLERKYRFSTLKYFKTFLRKNASLL